MIRQSEWSHELRAKYFASDVAGVISRAMVGLTHATLYAFVTNPTLLGPLL